MKPSNEKIEELVRAIHIISYEGYYFTEGTNDGEMNALFRTIIHLASRVLERDNETERLKN